MYQFQIKEAEEYQKGRYVLTMDGAVISYGSSVEELARCVEQLIRLPHAPQIRRVKQNPDNCLTSKRAV